VGGLIPTWGEGYLELLLVDVREAELDDVVRQRLHLPGYAEPVPVDLLVLLRFPKVQGVEALGDGEVLMQRLLSAINGEALAGTDAHHQQFLLLGLRRHDAVNLSGLEDHAVLSGEGVELEALLADALNAIGPREGVGTDVGLRDDVALVLLLELVAEVGVHH
jgi:hypothetical protein